MTVSIAFEQWLGVLDQAYLQGYLPGGGSSVKFAVCYPGSDPEAVSAHVREAARARGFLTADVRADQVKIQFIERLFGAIADQLPWGDLTLRVLAGFARGHDWRFPATPDLSRGLVAPLAAMNDLPAQSISLDLQREISTRILQDRSLAKEFRLAMYWLAKGMLEEGSHGPVFQQIRDWMGGRVAAISNMKPYQIHTKITRTNARPFFASLCSWVRKAGYPGLVTVLDGRRIVDAARFEDGTQSYTAAALMDSYEVLRQFIDATDEFDGSLLLVVMSPGFLQDDPHGRGMGRYPALMFRVLDEVRDRTLANPFGSLIRFGTISETTNGNG